MNRFTVSSRRTILTASIAALLGAAAAPQASAQIVKADNLDNLNLGTSWVGGVAPGATDIATWDATVTGPNSTVLGGDLTWLTLKITNPGGLVTIGGSNRLTVLGATGLDLTLSTQDVIINSALTVNGVTALGSKVLTLGGTGSLLNGAITGGVNNTTALNIAGGSTVLAGASTFAGQVTVGNGALLTVRNAAALGAAGAGNETIVNAGGTLDVAGMALGTEIIRIAGNGVGGLGALTNSGIGQNNALQFVTLTGDASLSSQGQYSPQFNSGAATSYGRMDIRTAGYVVGAKNLDLAGFTLTKSGGGQFSLVNDDVTTGNIIVNQGLFSIEGDTRFGAGSTITVNAGGRLGLFSLATTAVLPGITVAGGSLGDTSTTSAAQTLNSAINLTTGPVEFWAANGTAANILTIAGPISGTAASGVTQLAKRGGSTISLTNLSNSFDAPIRVYQGTLRADFPTTLTGGVAPAAPVTTTDTPLGTAGTITLAGGTLALRANMANDNTNQQFLFGKNIVVDLAPSLMTFDRIANATQTDKIVVVPQLTFAAASAANGYSIGQNQLTFTQANTHRLQMPLVTLNSDTVFTTGDFSFAGDVLSAGRNSLVRTGSNTLQFITPGTQEFNAFLNLGTGSVRVGTGFGTPTTSATVTLGSGAIYLGPNSSTTFRNPTNIGAGQTIDVVSQRVTQATVNFELFTAVPANLRAFGTGVLGVGSATAFGDIDLGRIGDGTFRIGSNFSGSGTGTITGVVSPGAGNVWRFGGSVGTVTLSGTNRLTGTALLEVGSPLINGSFATNTNNGLQNGTLTLTGANDFTGGITVNRGSTLRFQTLPTTGTINVWGTLAADQATGTFTQDGLNNIYNFSTYPGSTISVDNSALTTSVIPNRWGDNVPVALTASGFTFTSANVASMAGAGEIIGPVVFGGGSNLTINRGQAVNGHTAMLTVASLTRDTTGTLELVRSGGTGASFGSGQQLYSTAPPSVMNGMVSPSIVINGVTEQNTFATYGGTGFTQATFTRTVRGGTPTAGTFDTGLQTGTDVVYVDFLTGTTTLTLGDIPVLYALKVGAGTAGTTIANGVGTAIVLRSGGLIISGDATGTNFSNSTGTVTATINPALTFDGGIGSIEALVNARTGYTGVLAGTVTANGLTKFGAGTIQLNANNAATLTGPISVNQGTLDLRAAGAAGTGTITLNGGQLNLRAAAAFTLVNPLVIAPNIPIATLDVNRSDTTSTGIYTFNPPAVGPGFTMSGAAGSQGQTFNLSGANYTVTFGTNSQNTLNGNVTINNAVNLQMNLAPNITGINPVITKSGAGTWIVAAVTGGPTVVSGTTVVVNAGTLELRSLTSFGSGSQTSIILNGGALNAKRDTTGGTYGNTGSGYPVTVNGNATILVDRNSAGANIAMGLGPLTLNGNPTLTVNNGNGYQPFFPSITLNGLPTIASNVTPGDVNTAMRITGSISGAGFVKAGTGHMHLAGANNTYSGGTYVNQGVLRARAQNALGTGPVVVNPGGIIDFNAFNNMDANQPLIVRGNSTFVPMISMNTDTSHPTGGNVDTSAAPVGIVGLSNTTNGTFSNSIDMAAMYGGGWYLGGISTGAYDARYTAISLGVGAGNTYRLGGGGLAFVFSVDAVNTPQNNLLTGTANVVLGFDSGNIRNANTTTFQFIIGGTQDFGGSTIINRGTVTRLVSANNGTQSGLSSSAVNVFGNLILGSNASLATGGGTNVNNVTLHPGSALHLDSANGGGGIASAASNDRWGDNTALNLNGALVDLVGVNNAATTETVGSVTYSRGARIRVARTGTGTATLTLGSLALSNAVGNTLTLQSSAAGTLGVADQILVASAPPVPVNGMVSPSVVNLTDNTFVTYNVAGGFANVIYDTTVAATPIPAGLAATSKVDVNAAAAVVLSDNPVVYALRTNRDINVATSFSKITLRGGGLIAQGNALTIQPSLVFNNGSGNIEGRIYNSVTTTLNGSITAAGITKFGTGTLVIGMAQPDYASGWTINSGVLQINDLQGLGQSVPGNAITINATQTTGGSIVQTLTQSQLTLARDTGSPEVGVFTGGPITVVNEGTLRIGIANDRNLQSPPVTLTSTGTSSVGFTLDTPFSRARAILPSLTLNNDATMRVHDSGSLSDTGRVTAGVVNSLIGSGVKLNKIGNRTLELPGDNTTTWLGSSIVVSQGTLRVLHNGALGNAASSATIERNATLEIGVANFSPAAAVTQIAGSIERWNVENARPATYNLPAGVNLQLNTNLTGSHTIGLNGGSIEGFLWIDHPAPAVERTVSAATTIRLLANSFIGQNILQGFGYDAGRQPTVGQPFGDNITGSYLRIQGNVTGEFNLTKTGLDTVILAGTGNTYRNTVVDMGVLRIGGNNVLPTGGILTTRYAGTFDLNGFNQTVAGLGFAAAGLDPGATGAGSSGRIANSAITDNVLTVNANADYIYRGNLELNLALTKTGLGTLVLGGSASSYRGGTVITGGALQIDTLANGGSNSSIGASSSAAANLTLSSGGTLRYVGLLTGTTNRSLTLGDGGGAIDSSSGSAGVEFTSTASLGHTGAGPRTLTLTGTNAGPNTFAASIGNGAGVTSVTKEGPGNWTLSSTSAYTGATIVKEGALVLTGTINGSTTIDIRPSAVLDATALVAGMNINATQTLIGEGFLFGSINVAGTVNPGNTSGNLTVSGTSTFNTGSAFSVELAALNDYDRLTTAGAALNGTVNLAITLGFVPAQGSQFLVLENTSVSATTGNFTWSGPEGLLAEGEAFNAGGSVFTISYAAGTGSNDVVLTTIPEPGSMALLLGGLAMLAGRRRRK
jgi:autotransporter-associated beta strand protein